MPSKVAADRCEATASAPAARQAAMTVCSQRVLNARQPICPLEHPDPLPGGQPAVDRAGGQALAECLLPGEHPVLGLSKGQECPICIVHRCR
jgi:hypothetical protein